MDSQDKTWSGHKWQFIDAALPGIVNFNNGNILSIPSLDIRNFQTVETMNNRNYLPLLRYLRLAP